jgi:hypothetical protein
MRPIAPRFGRLNFALAAIEAPRGGAIANPAAATEASAESRVMMFFLGWPQPA